MNVHARVNYSECLQASVSFIITFPLNAKSHIARTNFYQTLFSSLDSKHVKVANTHSYLKIFAYLLKQYFELRAHILLLKIGDTCRKE